MSRISEKNLTPGMKLTRPVLNKGGLVMIGENTELTEGLIEKIREMDVGSVYVHGTSRELPPRDELLAQLDKRFSKVEEMPYMGTLKKVISEHIESLYEDHGSEDPQG